MHPEYGRSVLDGDGRSHACIWSLTAGLSIAWQRQLRRQATYGLHAMAVGRSEYCPSSGLARECLPQSRGAKYEEPLQGPESSKIEKWYSGTTACFI